MDGFFMARVYMAIRPKQKDYRCECSAIVSERSNSDPGVLKGSPNPFQNRCRVGRIGMKADCIRTNLQSRTIRGDDTTTEHKALRLFHRAVFIQKRACKCSTAQYSACLVCTVGKRFCRGPQTHILIAL